MKNHRFRLWELLTIGCVSLFLFVDSAAAQTERYGSQKGTDRLTLEGDRAEWNGEAVVIDNRASDNPYDPAPRVASPKDWVGHTFSFVLTTQNGDLRLDYGGYYGRPPETWTLVLRGGLATFIHMGKALSEEEYEISRGPSLVELHVENKRQGLRVNGKLIMGSEGPDLIQEPKFSFGKPSGRIRIEHVVIRKSERQPILPTPTPQLLEVIPGQVTKGEQVQFVLIGESFEEGMEAVLMHRGKALSDESKVFFKTNELALVTLNIMPDARVGNADLRIALVRTSRKGAARSQGMTASVQIVEAATPKVEPIKNNPVFHRLEPAAFMPGTTTLVTLFGENLDKVQRIVTPDGMNLMRGPTLTGSRSMQFSISLDDDAQPGTHKLGFTQDSEGIETLPFLILEPEPPSYLTRYLLGLAAAVGTAFAGGFTGGWYTGQITRWRRVATDLWERASKLEMPDHDQQCAWSCKASGSVEIADWEVLELRIERMPDGTGSKKNDLRTISGDQLEPLHKDASLRTLLESKEDAIAPLETIGTVFENYVREWRDESRSPGAVRIGLVLGKPLGLSFELMHREIGNDGALQWVSRRKWKRKLHAQSPEEVAVIIGPGVDENQGINRMADEFKHALADYLKRIPFRL